MKNVIAGQAAATTAAPTLHHGTYRRAIMAVLSAEVFTPSERLRTNHAVYECQDGAKLALWLKNVRRVAAEREAQAEAQALTNMAEGIERFEAKLSTAPAAAQPQAPNATPAQCDEVYKLACQLSAREKADALRRLPYLTEREATAFILGLKLRKGSRLRIAVGKRQYTVAERHFNAAAVDYVQETGTGRVLPRYETLYGGPLVRRVWAN